METLEKHVSLKKYIKNTTHDNYVARVPVMGEFHHVATMSSTTFNKRGVFHSADLNCLLNTQRDMLMMLLNAGEVVDDRMRYGCDRVSGVNGPAAMFYKQ